MEQYLGPLRPFVAKLADSIALTLTSQGFQAIPSRTAISDSLILISISIILSIILSILSNGFIASRNNRDAVLILGISGEGDAPAVGKTTLFKALRYGQQPKFGTVPSMKINEATFSAHGVSPQRAVRWADFPGHARLRPKLDEYLCVARCIVLVVDATRFVAQARRDAELLHEVLTHPVVAKNGTPLLVFLNKCDVSGMALSTVQTRLEAELERARVAKAGELRLAAVVDGDDDREGNEKRVALGFDNETFSFDQAASDVCFGSGSALTGDVNEVTEFVSDCF